MTDTSTFSSNYPFFFYWSYKKQHFCDNSVNSTWYVNAPTTHGMNVLTSHVLWMGHLSIRDTCIRHSSGSLGRSQTLVFSGLGDKDREVIMSYLGSGVLPHHVTWPGEHLGPLVITGSTVITNAVCYWCKRCMFPSLKKYKSDLGTEYSVVRLWLTLHI